MIIFKVKNRGGIMDNFEKTYQDIDELAKKIEKRIKELEIEEKKQKAETKYVDPEAGKNMADLDEIIRQIDARIAELEKEEEQEFKFDIEKLTAKVNKKLEKLDEVVEEDLGKTLYDLSEISKTINETIKALEAKRKEKKRKKAKYCDMARKKNGQNKKKQNKKKKEEKQL